MAKILVIEDEEFILELLSEMLRYEHYEVVCASTGEAGLQMVGTEHPDLILCDIVMSGMDGYSVLRILRQDHGNWNIPVIFLTGQVSPEEIQAGLLLGVNDYLCKPAARLDILSAIHRQLEKRQLQA